MEDYHRSFSLPRLGEIDQVVALVRKGEVWQKLAYARARGKIVCLRHPPGGRDLLIKLLLCHLTVLQSRAEGLTLGWAV